MLHLGFVTFDCFRDSTIFLTIGHIVKQDSLALFNTGSDRFKHLFLNGDHPFHFFAVIIIAFRMHDGKRKNFA